MNNKMDRKVIRMNIALFLYLCLDLLISSLFEPISEETVPWDQIFGHFPVLSMFIAFLMGLFLLLWGAKLLELFWNRVISGLLNLKEISFQEALSIVMVCTIVVASF